MQKAQSASPSTDSFISNVILMSMLLRRGRDVVEKKNHFDVTSIDRIRIWMPQKKRFSLHCKAFCPSSLLGFSAVCQLQGVLMMILSVMISDAINLAFLKAKRHNIRKSISVNGKFDKFWFVNVGLGPWPAQQPDRRRRRVNYDYWLHAQHMTLVYKLQSFFLASTQQFHNILLFNDYFYFIKLNKLKLFAIRCFTTRRYHKERPDNPANSKQLRQQ